MFDAEGKERWVVKQVKVGENLHQRIPGKVGRQESRAGANHLGKLA